MLGQRFILPRIWHLDNKVLWYSFIIIYLHYMYVMTFFLLRFRPVSYKEKLNNMTFEAKRPKHQEYDIPNFMMLFLHDQMCLYREGEQCIYIHTHTYWKLSWWQEDRSFCGHSLRVWAAGLPLMLAKTTLLFSITESMICARTKLQMYLFTVLKIRSRMWRQGFQLRWTNYSPPPINVRLWSKIFLTFIVS